MDLDVDSFTRFCGLLPEAMLLVAADATVLAGNAAAAALCRRTEAQLRGMPLSEIMAEVRRCSGGQFDPAIAAAFIRVVERDGAELVVNSAYEVMQNLALKTPQLA